MPTPMTVWEGVYLPRVIIEVGCFSHLCIKGHSHDVKQQLTAICNLLRISLHWDIEQCLPVHRYRYSISQISLRKERF